MGKGSRQRCDPQSRSRRFPEHWCAAIAQLTPPIILGVLHEIEARGSIETAKRIRQRIFATFVYAIARGIARHDPAEKLGAVLKPLRRGRQPAITEIIPLRKMIRTAEDDPARPVAGLAPRLLALTAVRPSELRGARWDELEDLSGNEPRWRTATRAGDWCKGKRCATR